MSYPLIIVTAALLLIAVAVVSREIIRPAGHRDFWAPPLLFSYGLILSSGGRLLDSFQTENLVQIIRTIDPSSIPEHTLHFVALYVFMATLAAYLGLYSRLGTRLGYRIWKSNIIRVATTVPTRHATRAALLLLAVGIFMYFYLLGQVGGLQHLWDNLHLRTTLTAGLGYAQTAMRTGLWLGIILLIWVMVQSKWTKRDTAIIALLAVLIAFMTSSFGGRAPLFSFVIILIMARHYFWKEFSPFSLLTGVIAFFLLIFFVIVGTARSPDIGFSDLVERPGFVLQEGLQSPTQRIVQRLGSYTVPVVLVSYFRPDKVWMGKGYRDIIYAPIPRRLYADKPPVDEGVYVLSIARGRAVEPGLPADTYQATAWPPGNWKGFMEWHLPGLLLLSYLGGVLGRAAYVVLLVSGRNPFWLFIYGGLNTFGVASLSVLGLVGILTTILGSTLLFFLVRALSLSWVQQVLR